MARYPGFMRLRVDPVDAFDDVRPVQQGFQQLDFRPFDIDLGPKRT